MWILNKSNLEELLNESEELINSSLSSCLKKIEELSEKTDIPIAVLEYGWKNCGKRFPREKFIVSQIDYNKLTDFDNLFPQDKILILWHDNDVITDLELYSLDLELLKKDYDMIRDKILNGEAHLIAEGDTKYLGASLRDGKSSQPYSSKLARNRDFALKKKYLQHVLDEVR